MSQVALRAGCEPTQDRRLELNCALVSQTVDCPAGHRTAPYASDDFTGRQLAWRPRTLPPESGGDLWNWNQKPAGLLGRVVVSDASLKIALT